MHESQLLRLRPVINILIIVAAIVSVVCIVLYFVGYGQLKYQGNSNQTLYINGYSVDESTVKLRPAVYDIVIQSPRHKSVHTKLRIGLFQTKVYDPVMTNRNPNDIAGAALGSYGYYGPPGLSNVEWFEQDTWLAGIVGPGSPTPAAFHYKDGSWTVAYFKGTGYPSGYDALPGDVAAYVASLSTKESPQ